MSDRYKVLFPLRSNREKMERLNSKVRSVWSIGYLIPVFIVTGAITFGVYRLGYSFLGILSFFPLAAIAFIFSVLRYRIWKFEIRDDEVYLHRGVFTRVETVVPFVRIQHVDSRRSPVERVTGLASVVIYTAGSRGADVKIPGLTPERAEELRETLRELAVETETEWEDAV